MKKRQKLNSGWQRQEDRGSAELQTLPHAGGSVWESGFAFFVLVSDLEFRISAPHGFGFPKRASPFVLASLDRFRDTGRADNEVVGGSDRSDEPSEVEMTWIVVSVQNGTSIRAMSY